MANRELNKEVLDSFIENFTEDLQKVYGENCSIENVVYHLIDRGVAATKNVRDYAIVHDFQEYKNKKGGSTIDFLISNEDKYQLSDRQIHTVIKKHTLKYCCGKYITNLP